MKNETIKNGLKVLLVAVIFSSCNNNTGINGDKVPLGNRTIQTIDYDNCEYVYLRRYGSVTITHKGNCNYCMERAKNNCH